MARTDRFRLAQLPGCAWVGMYVSQLREGALPPARSVSERRPPGGDPATAGSPSGFSEPRRRRPAAEDRLEFKRNRDAEVVGTPARRHLDAHRQTVGAQP